MVDDQGGLATCVDAKTEKKFGANDWAAITPPPIVAYGRIYAFSEEGKSINLAASRKVSKSLPKTN